MRLAKREKAFIITAVCIIAAMLLFEFLISPFFEHTDRLRRGIEKAESDYLELMIIKSEYEDYQNNSKGIEQALKKRQNSFRLFSFLEKAAKESQVKYEYMNPSTSKGIGGFQESIVDVSLQSITMDQLKNYLYKIEQPDNLIFIKRISIKTNRKRPGYLDTTLSVLTYQKA